MVPGSALIFRITPSYWLNNHASLVEHIRMSFPRYRLYLSHSLARHLGRATSHHRLYRSHSNGYLILAVTRFIQWAMSEIEMGASQRGRNKWHGQLRKILWREMKGSVLWALWVKGKISWALMWRLKLNKAVEMNVKHKIWDLQDKKVYIYFFFPFPLSFIFWEMPLGIHTPIHTAKHKQDEKNEIQIRHLCINLMIARFMKLQEQHVSISPNLQLL